MSCIQLIIPVLLCSAGPSPTVAPNESAVFIVPNIIISLPERANFIYTCTANHPVQFFEWLFNFLTVPGNAIPRILSSTSSQLVIQNVSQSNAGTYICSGRFADGDVQRSFTQLIYRGKKAAAQHDILCVKGACWVYQQGWIQGFQKGGTGTLWWNVLRQANIMWGVGREVSRNTIIDRAWTLYQNGTQNLNKSPKHTWNCTDI